MKSLLLAAAALLVAASPTLAQGPGRVTPLRLYSSAADVQAMIAKAKAAHKADNVNTSDVILGDPPVVRAQLEYRTGTTPASIHPGQAELMYVIDGGCMMTTGGTLVGKSGSDSAVIQGGQTRHIAKGDFILVPSNTPHQFAQVDGTLILMAVHMPQPDAKSP